MNDEEGSGDAMVEAIALSSPSGRMSKRVRKRAERRLELELFGPGGMSEAIRPRSRELTKAERIEHLRQRAADLRHLADGGMRPRVHNKEAARLEREAGRLEAEGEEKP
jgi:hypothetical protein